MKARVVVEWTRGSVRLAVGEGQGTRARLRAVRCQTIGGRDVSETLRELIRAAKVSSAEIIGVVSREQVLTRAVKFPATDPAELAQMAELYAKAQLPYPRDQTIMDSYVLDQQDGFSTVAIVACQRDVADRQLAVLREAGLSAGLLVVSSWGVLAWYRRLLQRANAEQAGLVKPANEPVLVVNVDDTRTDLVLISNDRIFSSRSLSQGAQDWQELGDPMELLLLEVERSFAALRKELPGTEVRSLLLTGLGPLGQWSQRVSHRLSLPALVVEAQQPFQALRAAPMPPMSPVVVGGLSCSEPGGLLNFAPPELRLRTRQRQQVLALAWLGVLLLAVLLVGAGALGVRLSRERRWAAQLDRALSRLEPNAKQVREQLHSSQLIESLLRSRRRLAVMLSGVFLQTPEAVTLEGLAFEGPRQELVLRGHAPSTQAVLEYLRELERVEGVTQVRLKYSTRRSTPAGELTDFEVILHYRALRGAP